jgi:hypothetical protein
MRLKTAERNTSDSPHTRTRLCAEEACGKTTREGKPFCLHHVEQHSYVQVILETLAEKDAEHGRVEREGPTAVDPEGLTAKELLLHLSQHGSRTVERLSREFQLTGSIMCHYVEALSRQGFVSTGRTTRGSIVVQPRSSAVAARTVA